MGISMEKWADFEYHVGKWLKYDRSGYNSSHPSLGSPLMVWCIELTSSGHFWSLPTCLKNGQNEIKLKQYTCLSGRRVFIFYFRTRCQAVWYPAYIFLLAQFGKHILVYFYKVVPSKKQGNWPKKDKKAKVLGDDSLKGLKIRQI